MGSCLCIRMMIAGRGSPVPAREWSVFNYLHLKAGEGIFSVQEPSRLRWTQELTSVPSLTSTQLSHWFGICLIQGGKP